RSKFRDGKVVSAVAGERSLSEIDRGRSHLSENDDVTGWIECNRGTHFESVPTDSPLPYQAARGGVLGDVDVLVPERSGHGWDVDLCRDEHVVLRVHGHAADSGADRLH